MRLIDAVLLVLYSALLILSFPVLGYRQVERQTCIYDYILKINIAFHMVGLGVCTRARAWFQVTLTFSRRKLNIKAEFRLIWVVVVA